MKILAIETSCDETGIALVKATGGLKNPRFEVLKNLVSSQIKIHRPFGGVVPNLAKREHLKNLPLLQEKIFGKEPFGTAQGRQIANRLWKKIDLITVTVGPGLEPALWTGIEFAKALAKEHKKPLIGANHLEGHLYSFLLSKPRQQKTKISNFQFPISKTFPAIALIVSGGHTILLKMESFSKWKRLGETRDDAAGEAFDKVARMLELPYPGGPEIEKLALRQAQGKPSQSHGTIAFPRPMLNDKNYDFSFSGLKTAVLYYLRDRGATFSVAHPMGDTECRTNADIAASFQKAAIDVLVAKTMRAAGQYGAKSVVLCGGVAANKALRSDMRHETRNKGLTLLVPDFKYNLDNAAMIGAAGYMAFLRKKKWPTRANGGMEV